MLRGVNIFCADPSTQLRALRRLLAVFLAPLALIAAFGLWHQYVPPDVVPPATVSLWLESLDGAPDTGVPPIQGLNQVPWQPIRLPYTAQPWADTSKHHDYRAWVRITLPDALQRRGASEGNLAVMANRVFASGPWGAWSDGQLLQVNRRGWGLQWNTPLRVQVPTGAQEMTLSLPVRSDTGYALGSVYVGLADDIDQAWREREWWMTGVSRVATTLTALLAVMALPLALHHRKTPMYTLLCGSAVVWAISNLQFLHDDTGNLGQSTWFGLVMDVSINWHIALTLLFCFEFLPQRLAWFKSTLMAYAVISTAGATLAHALGYYDLAVMHDVNFVFFCVAMVIYIRYWLAAPTRETTVLLLPQIFLLGMGLHWMLFISEMAQPDHVHTFPLAVLGSVAAFLYAISRRWAAAIHAAQVHQNEMQQQLQTQKVQLQEQHEHIAALKLAQQLQAQRQALLQDLHDGLGSNLTSALVQARSGPLAPEDAVLLLQELAQELRQFSASSSPTGTNVGHLLAELRQRIDKRLARSGIELLWDVSPVLPTLEQLPANAGVHLRAILNEAIANALKHAQASEVRVHASVVNGTLVVTISDNGTDHPTATAGRVSGGLGLRGMHARALGMGWKLQAGPREAPDLGFAVKLQVPINMNSAKTPHQ